MGDIGSGDASGVVMAQRPVCDNPDPASISKENWALAEELTQEVVNDIHPTLDSEERRNNVIDYVQRLLKSSLGFEVFSYGSVPLKTYLPDGDIDLTILSSPGAEASWAADVLSVLQREEKNENAEFEVKDTQFIDAEVKLVKCLVQNIVIDISFNQFGGLCTLCFLEQVDRLVGKDHLFKRSIILIKAWCYYESRILGAHHGLLSTYALETLVLFTFHLFHSSLDGPLAVLYKFLDYFSKFDWENYCISLKGPVIKSSLPEIVAQMPQQEGNHLMLAEEFLRNCMELFSMPSLGEETNSRVFSPKHLNIIDPLKEYNNLGRSVHRGNFYRIRSAFRYGARKLGRVLSLPKDEIADEIKNFFSNTLQRHGGKYGSFTPDYAPELNGGGGSVSFLSTSHAAVLSEDHMHLISSSIDSENDGSLMEERHNSVHPEIYSVREAFSQTMPCLNYSVKEALFGYCLNGDACDLARHSYQDFRTSNATSDCSPSSNPSVSSLTQVWHVPLLCLSNSSPKNGHSSQTYSCNGVGGNLGLDTWLEHKDDNMQTVNISESCSDSLDDYCSCSSAVSSPKTNISENLSHDFRERDSGSVDDTEPLNPLADLLGDYDSHIRSFLHGPFFHKLALSEPVLLHLPLSPSHLQNKKQWHTVHQSMPLERHSFSRTNRSNISIGQPASSLAPCISTFAPEEKQKARGTGTYLPITNNYCRDGLLQGWERSSSSPGIHRQSQKHSHGNGCNSAISEMHNSAKGDRELFHAWCPVQVQKKSGLSCQSPRCGKECRNGANGFSNTLERIEFGSIGHLVDEVISASCKTCVLVSNNHLNASSGFEKAEEKVADEPFGLKNEDEFPPLSI